MRGWRAVTFCGAALAGTLMPWLIMAVNRPSAATIEDRRDVEVGTLTTQSGGQVEVHVVLGNVFRPKRLHGDLGFDVATVSLYFDPVRIQGRDLLLVNPLFANAVRESLSSAEELDYFLNNVVEALEASRDVVLCIRDNNTRQTCKGDQIKPYVWPAFRRSPMVQERGVKYLAALPLFDPQTALGNVDDSVLHDRLRRNVHIAIRRLFDVLDSDYRGKVQSAAFAALGSTSQAGGDSPAFLSFTEGFLAILRSLEESRPPTTLGRVYLVAFDQHTGVFRSDAIAGLRSAADYVCFRRLVSGALAALIGGVLALLFFVMGIASYQSLPQALGGNRWAFLDMMLGVLLVPASICWGTAVLVFQGGVVESTAATMTIYSVLVVACSVGVLWTSKRLHRRQQRAVPAET